SVFRGRRLIRRLRCPGNGPASGCPGVLPDRERPRTVGHAESNPLAATFRRDDRHAAVPAGRTRRLAGTANGRTVLPPAHAIVPAPFAGGGCDLPSLGQPGRVDVEAVPGNRGCPRFSDPWGA